MLTIRLQRSGKKNKVQFRLVLAEKHAAANKKFIEVLGSYNPHSKQLVLPNDERLQYWVSQHVEISPSAHNLLVTHKKLDATKVKAFTTPKKEVAKVEEAPKAEAAEEKTEAVVEETPATEETSVENTPAE